MLVGLLVVSLLLLGLGLLVFVSVRKVKEPTNEPSQPVGTRKGTNGGDDAFSEFMRRRYSRY